MKKILIFLEHYLPGFKSGGPLKSVKNITDLFGNEAEFYIVTLDRDLGDSAAYPQVEPDTWLVSGKARVLYCSSEQLTFRRVVALMSERDYEVIYLNSFFSFRFGILPSAVFRWLNLECRLLIAPRGEFSKGALQIKPLKKNLFIRASKAGTLYRNAHFHASTELEKANLFRVLGEHTKVVVAKDLPDLDVPDVKLREVSREGRGLRICFISRIVPVKNLDYAIKVLGSCRSPIEFCIYGILEDPGYWRVCENLLADLPDNVQWRYGGALSPQQVKETFSKFDLFLFPTRGENYGHVIAESLLSGTFVLTSDQTPWKALEREALGRVIPLDEFHEYVHEIESWASVSPASRYARSLAIREHSPYLVVDSNDVDANRLLFSARD